MNELSMFRLKMQYKSEVPETGELEKTKLEVLAQCVNYTDAESLTYRIIKQFNMDKFEPCLYDIVKMKLEATDIYGFGEMSVDMSELVCGLYQHYFANEDDGLYAVETIVFGDKELKEKDYKHTYYVPAANVADAMNATRKILSHSYSLDDCFIPSAKLDKADYIYLRPSTSREIYDNVTKLG